MALQAAFDRFITTTERTTQHGSRWTNSVDCTSVTPPPIIVATFPESLRGDVIDEMPLDTTVTLLTGGARATYILRALTFNPGHGWMHA